MSIPATVLLTRPAGRNESLADRLAQLRIASVVVPGLQLRGRWGQVDAYRPPQDYDALVFVSGNAARYYFEAMRRAGDILASSTYLACVGQATAQALISLPGVQAQQLVYPAARDSLQDSEALWACLKPYLSRWRRVLLVRGDTGREWLGQQFEQAGLEVDRIAVYTRGPAVWSNEQRLALRGVPAESQYICLLSSSESVRAIAYNVKQLGLFEQWAKSCFIVIHPRIESVLREVLREAGLNHAIVVKRCRPTDDSIIEAILASLSHE